MHETVFEGELYKFFAANGHQIAKAKVIFDNVTKKSRKFGYLNFKSEADAIKCLEEMNNKELNGRPIILSRKKDQEFESQANLLVKNLPETYTQD